MLKLVFFVPASHVENVKQALFSKGAGQSQGYTHCCWQVEGQMQYKPGKSSHPREGNKEELVYTKTFRIEMVCPEALITDVITELKRVHPYEVPAYEIYRLETDPAAFLLAG